MDLIDLSEGGRVVRGYMIGVPHNGRILIFDGDPIEEENPLDIVVQAEKRGLRLPTTSEAISLIYSSVVNFDALSDVIKILCKKPILTCTKNLRCPEGIFVYDDIDWNMKNSQEELLQLYKDGDKRVRFSRYYFTNESGPSLEKFLNSDYVRAQAQENFDKICNFVLRFKSPPSFYAPFGKGTLTYSSISVYKSKNPDESIGNLSLSGNETVSKRKLCSFGVLGFDNH